MQRHVSILFWDVQLDESREYTEETADEGVYEHGSYDKTKDICLRLLLKTTGLVVKITQTIQSLKATLTNNSAALFKKAAAVPPWTWQGTQTAEL